MLQGIKGRSYAVGTGIIENKGLTGIVTLVSY
jgi:hypothetical protein